MEFLDLPLFDNDFYKLIFRFCINMLTLTIVIRYLYYGLAKKKDYFFTYYMIGIIVFLLCFTLKKYELDIGMALGLFAIFGILRYRTNPIEIKEMTYLFVVIGISVINSLANQKVSYAELMSSNLIVVMAIFVMEKYWLVEEKVELSRKIIYEKIENIKPENHELLKSDLEERTGLIITDIRVGEIDFLKDTAVITINYSNPTIQNSNDQAI